MNEGLQLRAIHLLRKEIIKKKRKTFALPHQRTRSIGASKKANVIHGEKMSFYFGGFRLVNERTHTRGGTAR